MPKTLMVKLSVLVMVMILFGLSILNGQEDAPKAVKAIEIIGLKSIKKEEILPLLKTKVTENFNEKNWAIDKVTLLNTGYFKEIKMEEKVRSTYVLLTITVEESEYKRTVKSIEVIGLKNIPQAQIIANMKTQVGFDFDARAFDRDLVKLHSMSFSKDIKATPERLKDGYVIKIFMSEDIDWYDDFDVYMPKGTKGGVKKNMEEQILLSKDGDYLDATHIDMVKRRIREYFKTKGFFFIDIQSSIRLEKDKKVLLFTIDRGAKLKVGELLYSGNKRYSQKFLISNANIKVRPFWKYASGNVFDEGKFEEDKAKLSAYYNMNGFVNAKIEVDPFVYNATKDRVYLKFNINEGPRYFIGSIKFTGNTLFPQEDLIAVLKSWTGNHFNAKIIYDDAKNIEGLYGEEGRCFSVVEPKFNFDTDRHVVDVIYAIKESGVVKIGKVFVNGNDVTKESVFLRELEIFPGDSYDKYKFDRSKWNIQRLPFVDGQALKMEVMPSGEDTGDLIIDIKEKQSGNLSFNVSLTEFTSLAAGVKISETNFNWQSLFGMDSIRGGGQAISAEGQFGLKAQRYSINFVNPMIFDVPVKFAMSSYLTEKQYREYDMTQLGGKLSLSRKILSDIWGGVGFRLERANISKVDDNVAQIIEKADKDYIISAFNFFLSYDKLNNPSMPSSGFLVRLGETVSEDKVIGERSFTATSFEFSTYLHLTDRIDDLNQKKYPYYFALHVDADASFAYNGDEVPLTERYVTGGTSSVRGFKPGRLAPKDSNGRLYPGNFRLVGNFELNIPLYNDFIYLAPFIDAGYVWDDIQDYNIDDIRISTGVTFKFRIPALQNQPILLSLSHSLRDKGDEVEVFSFSFVTAF